MADFITFACPSCGGQLEGTKDSGRVICGYCGNEHIIRRTETLDRTASELAIDRIQKEIQILKNSRSAIINQPETEILKNNGELLSLEKEIEIRNAEIAKLTAETEVNSGNVRGVILISLFVGFFFSAIYFGNAKSGVASNMSLTQLLFLLGMLLLLNVVGIIRHAIAVSVSKRKQNEVAGLKKLNEKQAGLLQELRRQKIAAYRESSQPRIADIEKQIHAKQNELNSHYQIVSNNP